MIYFVETRSSEQRHTLCRWVERFHEEGKKVLVVTDSTAAAQHLDQLLWTFSETSFIPHRILSLKSGESMIDPVILTIGEVRLEGFDVLVCDSPVHLNFMKGYPVAVHFILLDDEEKRQESRLMWQSAREQGVRLNHVPYTSR